MNYKFLPHTADVKFQAFGGTVEEAFSNAVLALRETISGKVNVFEKKEKKISVEGKDFESLLYNFLEEFLVLLDAEGFLVSKVKEIKIDAKNVNILGHHKNKKSFSDRKNFELKAVVLGDDALKYKFSNAVKAITYNDMFVKQDQGLANPIRWAVQVVVDV